MSSIGYQTPTPTQLRDKIQKQNTNGRHDTFIHFVDFIRFISVRPNIEVLVSNLGHPEECRGLSQSLKSNSSKYLKSGQDNCLPPLLNALFILKFDDIRSQPRAALLNKHNKYGNKFRELHYFRGKLCSNDLIYLKIIRNLQTTDYNSYICQSSLIHFSLFFFYFVKIKVGL